MFQALFDFFRNIFLNHLTNGGILSLIIQSNITLFGTSVSLLNYICLLMALVSLIVILVLCCLFVYRIIKLVGGLIR